MKQGGEGEPGDKASQVQHYTVPSGVETESSFSDSMYRSKLLKYVIVIIMYLSRLSVRSCAVGRR